MRPLTGIKVVEMAGLAPSPYCGMLLSDFGADVVIVDRPSRGGPEIPNIMPKNPFDRGKRSIRVNLKTDQGVEIVRRMIRDFDVLLEPYRPGVMEALGLGPNEALELNPRLIYARLTGWGKTGLMPVWPGMISIILVFRARFRSSDEKVKGRFPPATSWAILQEAVCSAQWVFFLR